MLTHIISGTAVALAICLTLWFTWNWLLKKFESPHVKLLGNGAEVVLALLPAPIAFVFELYKKESWTPLLQPIAIWGTALTVSVGLLYAALKMLNFKAKDKDTAEIARLKGELAKAAVEVEGLTHQRNWATQIRELIGRIVGAKMLRIREAWEGRRLSSSQQFMLALNPLGQIDQILLALHRTYQRNLAPEQQLRLGVYLRQGDVMGVMFSYDGKTHDCFSKASSRYMEVADPDGPQSVITQLLNSPKAFRIIPDCATEPGFEYFRREQRDYIKSMVAMKKVVYTPSRGVVILAMDASTAGFFSESDKREIELCCSEILKRLEFELLMHSIVTDGTFQDNPPQEQPTSNQPLP